MRKHGLFVNLAHKLMKRAPVVFLRQPYDDTGLHALCASIVIFNGRQNKTAQSMPINSMLCPMDRYIFQQIAPETAPLSNRRRVRWQADDGNCIKERRTCTVRC
jgi:hypothetical protein